MTPQDEEKNSLSDLDFLFLCFAFGWGLMELLEKTSRLYCGSSEPTITSAVSQPDRRTIRKREINSAFEGDLPLIPGPQPSITIIMRTRSFVCSVRSIKSSNRWIFVRTLSSYSPTLVSMRQSEEVRKICSIFHENDLCFADR